MSAEVEAHLAAGLDRYVAELQDFCAIPSISAQPAHKADVERAARFAADRLTTAGLADVAVHPTAGHPVVTAGWHGADHAPTVLVYGHYDVQPPEPLDAWRTPPFEPTVRDDRLYARGASDDKGPLLIPILVAEAFLAVRGSLPVNLKFLIEGEEECGSPHLEAAIGGLADRLAADLVLSADGAMWRADLPSVIVASRGLLALDLTVQGAAKDLHSGRHGGSAPNPLAALARLVAGLHDADGRVAVAGFYDGIRPPDPAILRTIEAARFDAGRYFTEIGARAPHPLPSGVELLRRQWLEPTLELNGLNGGYGGDGTKTVIPARACAKITCRLAAGQDPDRVFEAIREAFRAKMSGRLRARGHAPWPWQRCRRASAGSAGAGGHRGRARGPLRRPAAARRHGCDDPDRCRLPAHPRHRDRVLQLLDRGRGFPRAERVLQAPELSHRPGSLGARAGGARSHLIL